MRDEFERQLALLNEELTTMGGLIESAIANAVKALDGDEHSINKAYDYEKSIDNKEREIESLCLKLLLTQQPVASDLRLISAALKMITDMERIGDQAEDIAEITLRRGTAAAHYVLGGPQGNDNNAFSLGTAATEINVMNGKTAANAMYTGRLAKDQKAGKDLQPTIDKMNALIDDYDVKSKPLFCAQAGLVDEIVDMPMMRNYIVAFTDAVYQNPESICPFHQMLLPRTIRDYDNLKK